VCIPYDQASDEGDAFYLIITDVSFIDIRISVSGAKNTAGVWKSYQQHTLV
jgi:hypothetical protein